MQSFWRFAMALLLMLALGWISEARAQLSFVLGDPRFGPYNPDSVKVDTNHASPTYNRIFAYKGFVVEFDVNVFSMPDAAADTASALAWYDMDTTYGVVRGKFDTLKIRYGTYKITKKCDLDSANGHYFSRTFYLYFNSYVPVDSVLDFLRSIPHVTARYSSRHEPEALIPNDRALDPTAEFGDLIWNTTGYSPFWPWYYHRQGFEWTIYKMGLPMAWELTMGKDEVAIGVVDHFGTVSQHPDMENFIRVTSQGDGTKATGIFGNGHGLGVSSVAVARGNNDNTTDRGLGMIGTCPTCKAVNEGFYSLPDVDMDGTSGNGKTFVDIATTSSGFVNEDMFNPTDANWITYRDAIKRCIDSGIVCVAAAGNTRDDYNQGYLWAHSEHYTDGDGKQVRLLYPTRLYPTAYLWPDAADPDKDVRVIAVGSTDDGTTYDVTCKDWFSPGSNTGAPIMKGDEHFPGIFNYGYGKLKFDRSSNTAVRQSRRELAFMDILACQGSVAAIDERPAVDCGSEPRREDFSSDVDYNEAHYRWADCSSMNEVYYRKYSYQQGTSLAAPEVAGIVGLMLSINKRMGVNLDLNSDGVIDNGAEVQRRVYDALTFTADKIHDEQNFRTDAFSADWLEAPDDLVQFATVNNDGSAVQYDYQEQTDDQKLHRSWAQRTGFGRVNAYRAVAHSIANKAPYLFSASATLTTSAGNGNENESGRRLIHMGAWKNATDRVLDVGGVSLPGEGYNNQGVTKINGTGTVITVPTDAILAIDGIVTTEDATGQNKITSNGNDAKICLTGMLENVEVVGNTRVDRLIIRGSSSSAMGRLSIGSSGVTSEVYDTVEIRDYGRLKIDHGTMILQPGGAIKPEGFYGPEISDGGALEMEHGSSIYSSSGVGIVVKSGSVLRVKAGAHVDILTNVTVQDGGLFVVESGAVVNLKSFHVERGGEIAFKSGSRVALTASGQNICNGRMRILGNSGHHVHLTGRVEDCCEGTCTNVVAPAWILVQDPQGDAGDTAGCNLKIEYAEVSNVPIRALHASLYPINNSTFSASSAILNSGPTFFAKNKVLLDVQNSASSLANYPLSASLPTKDKLYVISCTFTDVDGRPSGPWTSTTFQVVGVNASYLKRTQIANSAFQYLLDGASTHNIDSIGISSNTFDDCNKGIDDNGSALRICDNSFKRSDVGTHFTASRASQIVGNTFSTVVDGNRYEESNIQYVRGNIYFNYTDGAQYIVQTVADLGVERVARNPWLYYYYGRNVFDVPDPTTQFGTTAFSKDIMLMSPQARVYLECGYNKLAEKSLFHLYSITPQPVIVMANEFRDVNSPYFIVRANSLVTPSGTPINVSASSSGCSVPTGSDICSPYPPPPAHRDVDYRYVDDGTWVELASNDYFLDTVYARSRVEMVDTSFATHERIGKAHDALHAAILGDSVTDNLSVLVSDFSGMLAQPFNPDELKSAVTLLLGEIYERLSMDSLAAVTYEDVTTSYPSLADSLPAAWRLQRLETHVDTTFGTLYDSSMVAYRERVLRDLRRTVPDSASLIPKRIEGYPGAESAGVTTETTLSQNIPNPFSRETAIPFVLGHEGWVRLYITDQTGKRVMDLIDHTLPVGPHSISVSTENLQSGAYYYHLEFDGQTRTRQMSITK